MKMFALIAGLAISVPIAADARDSDRHDGNRHYGGSHHGESSHGGYYGGGRSYYGDSRHHGSRHYGEYRSQGHYRPYYGGYGDNYELYGYPYYGYYPSVSFAYSPSSARYYSGSRYRSTETLEMAVQRELRSLGYYRGGIDGDIGPGSRAAIRAYQADRRLSITGRIDKSLLDSLRM